MSWVNKKLILECLKELADKSYQERVWTVSSGPEISSFTEAVNQLYGDSGLDTSFDKNESVFGKDIDDKLKVFGTALQTIPHRRPPMDLINDDKMIPIRKTAANIASLIEGQKL
jgi:uncharacterized protein YfaA (DUF2138 family)